VQTQAIDRQPINMQNRQTAELHALSEATTTTNRPTTHLR